MPKVRPLGSPESKAQVLAYAAARKRGKAEDAVIQEDIRLLRAVINRSHRQIAGMLGMTADTWRYRRNNPQSFKLGEIRMVQELAKQYGREVRFG